MRLIRTSDFSFTDFNTGEAPPYAILSHKWQEDEVLYQHCTSRVYRSKRGFSKVREACRIAKRYGYEWLWIDTCCINKQDSVELNEAINAMYRWYKEARVCIAYLFDHTDGVDSFGNSSWFGRCWTLQELIAPQDVKFFDSRWKYIGSKISRDSEIASITGIPKFVLRGGDPQQCSIAQRMSWAAHRKATRIEDQAYSLLGLFGLALQPLYGTGAQAFQELQQKLLQKHDQSILSWDRALSPGSPQYTGLLADSPAAFANCRETESMEAPIGSVRLSGDAIELDMLTIPYSFGVYLCIIECSSAGPDYQNAIFLQRLDSPNQYARVLRKDTSVTTISVKRILNDATCRRLKFYVYHELRHAPPRIVPGIYISGLELLRQYRSKRGHDHVRVLSRRDGCVNMTQDGTLVQLARNQWGTVGLIYFDDHAPNFRHWRVAGVKLGFDEDFCPIVRLGVGSHVLGDLRSWTRHPPAAGTREFRKAWDNSWICEALAKKTKTEKISHGDNQPYEIRRREYYDDEYFDSRGFEQLEAHSLDGASVHEHYLGLSVKLVLCDLHDAERPLRRGEQPWKVWTLKIRETRDFAQERKKRHSIIAIVGAAVAGGLAYNHVRARR